MSYFLIQFVSYTYTYGDTKDILSVNNTYTVLIFSVGAWLEGKNHFFDTNRKD